MRRSGRWNGSCASTWALAAVLVWSGAVEAQDERPECPGQARQAAAAEHALCWFERAKRGGDECGDDDASACTRHAAAWCSEASLDDPRVGNACFLSLVRTGQLDEATELAEYLAQPTPTARRCRQALSGVATLRVVTNPPGGIVAVDGREYGPAPIEVRLSAPWWEHEATVSFDDTEVTVSSEEIVGAFDEQACEMTDLVVDGPEDASAPGSSVPSPRETAQEGQVVETGGRGALPTEDRAADDGGIHTEWWFWTGVGAVVAGGVLASVLVATSSDNIQREEPIPGEDGMVVRALEMP